MLIKDVLLRDPSTHGLVNNGQARIANEDDDGNVSNELRGELSTFVCEGQYSDGIQKILSSFLRNQNQTSQRGAWVSGFFGSGKSHLLKMLCHLWQDTAFPDGATARSIVPELAGRRSQPSARTRYGGQAVRRPFGRSRNSACRHNRERSAQRSQHSSARRRPARSISASAVRSVARRTQATSPK